MWQAAAYALGMANARKPTLELFRAIEDTETEARQAYYDYRAEAAWFEALERNGRYP